LNYSIAICGGIILLILLIGVFTTYAAFGQVQSEVDIQAGSGSSSDASCVTLANCFSPNVLNVAPGTTVIWNNSDSVSHTITSVDNRCNGPHFTIEVETDNRKVDPTVMVRTSFTEIIYAKLAQYQPYAADNAIAPIRKLVYEAYVSPASKSFEVVVVEGIGRNIFSVHKTVNVSGCDVGSLFDSGIIKPDKTFDFTFSNAGNYNYFCTIHPWMMGQIVVTNLASGKQSHSLQSLIMETTNATTHVIIPEFPLSTMSAMIVGFIVLTLMIPLVMKNMLK
jgi:plastocyanin